MNYGDDEAAERRKKLRVGWREIEGSECRK